MTGCLTWESMKCASIGNRFTFLSCSREWRAAVRHVFVSLAFPVTLDRLSSWKDRENPRGRVI
jgi:hypothetical protein